MNETIQQILAGAAVFGALLYLLLRGRRKKGCQSDGGCGCAKKEPLK